MLSDVGYDQRFAVRDPPQVVHHVSCEQSAVVGHVLDFQDGTFTLQLVDMSVPLVDDRWRDPRQQLLEDLTRVADERKVDLDVLVDLGWVELDMNLLGVFGVGLQVARDAVVEAHADGDDQVGLLNRAIHPGFAVHTHHAQRPRMTGRKPAQPKQGAGHRNVGALDQFEQLLGALGFDHTVSAEDDGTLGGRDHARRLFDIPAGYVAFGAITRQTHRRVVGNVFTALLLGVFGDVHHDRPRSTGTRDVESLADRRSDVLGFRHQ